MSSDVNEPEESHAPTVVTRYNGSERRRAYRETATHPVKVYDERAEKYFAGRTSNASNEGALLILQRTMPIAAGDRLHVAIAFRREDVVVHQDAMIPSEVVRVAPVDSFTQAVAVRFLEAGALMHESPDASVATVSARPARESVQRAA